MESFEELTVWQQARRIRQEISVLTKSFPSEERYRLVDQLIRCSRSTTANIAEGYGRFHHQENIQFCRQARGSLTETLDHLICAFDEKYISEAQFNELRKQIQHCTRTLNRYIAYLKRAKESSG